MHPLTSFLTFLGLLERHLVIWLPAILLLPCSHNSVLCIAPNTFWVSSPDDDDAHTDSWEHWTRSKMWGERINTQTQLLCLVVRLFWWPFEALAKVEKKSNLHRFSFQISELGSSGYRVCLRARAIQNVWSYAGPEELLCHQHLWWAKQRWSVSCCNNFFMPHLIRRSALLLHPMNKSVWFAFAS